MITTSPAIGADTFAFASTAAGGEIETGEIGATGDDTAPLCLAALQAALCSVQCAFWQLDPQYDTREQAEHLLFPTS